MDAELAAKGNVYVSEKLLNHKLSDGKRLKPKELHEIVQSTNEARKLLNIKDSDNIPKIIIADDSEFVGAVAAAYNPVENALFINKSINQIMQAEEYFKQMATGQNELSTYVHELIHWKDAEAYRKTGKPLKNYMKWLNEKCRIKLDKLAKKGYNIDSISEYATRSLRMSRYDEVYTEYRVLQLLQGGIEK